MNTSEHINELAAAMAKAQAVIENPKKDSENPHFKSTYADLASGLLRVRPALSAQAIMFTQITEITDDGVILRTRLIHASGQWIESTYPVSKFAPHQQLGAALTYAKRQALFALVGICGEDEDDDGNAANTADTRSKVAPPARKIERAPAPEVVALSIDESADAAALMLKALDFCSDRESLHEWAQKNKPTKVRLTTEDQARVTKAFNAKQIDIQNIPQQAAE